MSNPYKYEAPFKLSPEGVYYMCGFCEAEIAPNSRHGCPGATHHRIEQLEERVATLEAWIKKFQELNR